MPEPLTIYECSTGRCGHRAMKPGPCRCHRTLKSPLRGTFFVYEEAAPVRVFREEDVKGATIRGYNAGHRSAYAWAPEQTEAAARAYYMADREVTEAAWEQAPNIVKNEYRKVVEIVLGAAREWADGDHDVLSAAPDVGE